MKSKMHLVSILCLLFSLNVMAGSGGAHPHHAAIFAGTTVHSGHANFSLGVDYEFRLPFLKHYFGVGALADFTFTSSVTQIYGAGVFVHPIAGLKFLAAPCAEIHSGHAVFLMRIGVAYDFHLGMFSISPTVNVDIVKGSFAGVFGVAFGVGF